MKKALKIIFTVSILIFLVLWILSKFMDKSEFNTMEIRNILVLIYLVSSLKYYKMEVDDKNTEIENLKAKLKEN
jgi:hypothetical protein